MFQRLKGWRTVICHGALTSVGAVLLTLDQMKGLDWTQYVGSWWGGIIVVGIGITGIWLRVVTTGPVGKRDDV
jgi:hypothetical protein